MLRFFFLILIFSVKVVGQRLNDSPLVERSDHLFFEGYYFNAMQSNIFQNDLLLPEKYKENHTMNFIINALRINEYGAEKLMANFLDDYPFSPFTKYVYFDLANYYFNIEKYPYALKWFSKLEAEDIAKKHLPRYNFNKGYSFFASKRYEKAIPYLEKVKEIPAYESDAYYYLGHIAYQLEDFEKATSVFNLVTNKGQQEDLNYFKADMNYRLGRFQNAIVAAIVAMETTYDQKQFSELSKIIGESHFNLSEYDKAIPFLEDYEGKKGKWENIDFYQLGYAYYKNKDYVTAISHFNKIIGSNEKFAQYANYYLADCYLKMNEKLAAFNAFRSASKMNFNRKISEDALFNYAKLSYELGNPYEKTPEVLVRFIEKYPKNKEVSTILELLINSYTKAGNYDAALNILEGKNSYKNNLMLQKISYLKAMNLFRSGRFKQAISFFNKSIKSGKDNGFKALSTFWMAHSNYELNQFDLALKNFQDFTKIPLKNGLDDFKHLDYHIAYTYFKKKDYEAALNSFESFINQKITLSKDYERDVYLRIGDCNFTLKKYWPAMENYNKATAIAPNKSAYATYQKGISYGFVDRNKQKIKTLKELILLIPNSSFADDALFELAAAHTISGNYTEAIAAYDALISRFKNSPYRTKAWLNKGLILYNQESYDSAEDVLKTLIVNYQTDVVVQQAVNTLKEIAIDRGRVQEFSQWLDAQQIEIFTDSELEQTAFIAAERQYLENNKNKAITLLEAYLAEYPNGINRITANYLLAEIYYENEFFESAAEKYKIITTFPINEYSEKALVRLIEILKFSEELSETLFYLKELDTIAAFEENKRFAKFNLMQVYFILSDYSKAISVAEEVLKLPALETKVKWDAIAIIARSYWSQNDTTNAAFAYQKLEKAPSDEIVSEALYFKAKQLHESAAFEQSNEIIALIGEKSASSEIWGPKALLILSKNYKALGDTFQATFILESVIENFENFNDILIEATDLLNSIKAEAAKENASIEEKTTISDQNNDE